MPTPSVVNFAYGDGRNIDPQPVLPVAPVAGNMLVECLYVHDNSAAFPAINGWSKVSGLTNNVFQVFWRIVQPGDTATFPKTTNGNTGYLASIGYQLANAGPSLQTSLDSFIQTTQVGTGTASTSTGPVTPVNNAVLSLLFGFDFFSVFPNVPTINAGNGWTADTSSAGFTEAGISGHQTLATPSALNATITWGGTTPTDAGVLIFNVFDFTPPPVVGGGLLLRGIG